MIRIARLTNAHERAEAADLLHACGLRLSPDLDALLGAFSEDGALLGCGGYAGAVIRCVAVRDDARGLGVMSALVSQLVTALKERGQERIFVYTRPQSAPRFTDLGFYILAETEEAVLLENRADGITRWLSTLPAPERDGGAVVINGNPFTRGHRYLIESAARACGMLYVFVLSEDVSRFAAEERLAMARAGCADLPHVRVVAGGPYCISRATFPDYFLKRADDGARVYAALDATLFARRIAPALRIRARFAGSEPLDAATAAYNAAMARTLPAHGIAFHELERLCENGAPVSASRLRRLMDKPDLAGVSLLAPAETRPYLIGQLAYEALTAEAEATPKPGLVDRNGSGAHRDMHLALLLRSAAVLRPYFSRFAACGQAEADLPLAGRLDGLRALGVEAEEAMLHATGGVNTHRGAIFTIGIFAYLAGRAPARGAEELCMDAAVLCAGLSRELPAASSHGGRAFAAHGARGLRGEAEDGYPSLTRVALPVYEALFTRGVPENDALTWTLLHLIAHTDDTNLLHRGGPDGAVFAKSAAKDFLSAHDPLDADYAAALDALDKAFTARNLSPGGAADLLAATRFLHTVCAR